MPIGNSHVAICCVSCEVSGVSAECTTAFRLPIGRLISIGRLLHRRAFARPPGRQCRGVGSKSAYCTRLNGEPQGAMPIAKSWSQVPCFPSLTQPFTKSGRTPSCTCSCHITSLSMDWACRCNLMMAQITYQGQWIVNLHQRKGAAKARGTGECRYMIALMNISPESNLH